MFQVGKKNVCITASTSNVDENAGHLMTLLRLNNSKQVDHPYSNHDQRSNSIFTLNATRVKPKVDVTVVTAFFEIGQFTKEEEQREPRIYFEWAAKLRYLQNPLVVYTDSEAFRSHVIKVRSKKSGKTVVRTFNTSSSWAFQNRNRIKTIFDSPGYPKFHPNTANPIYTCAQHAKYDAIAQAVKEKYFRTKYYMWLDAGYFRDRQSHKPFYLTKPSQFDDSKIAMNLVDTKSHLNTLPQTIILGNLVWVGGGLVFGDRVHIAKFARDFQRAVQYFLSQGMINTDQQVIYAMYTPKGKEILRPVVQLQLYQPPQDWFYLGMSMVREII